MDANEDGSIEQEYFGKYIIKLKKNLYQTRLI